MKAYIQLVAAALAMSMMVGCEDLENKSHYDEVLTSNENIEIKSVDSKTMEYLSSREDLSQMSQLLSENGIFDKLAENNQLYTLLVVANDNFYQPTADSALYVANSHVTDIAVSPSKLNSGDRILMWHDKYVTITADEEAENGNIIGHVFFNNASLSEVIKTADGYIYVISEMIATPTSLQDYLTNVLDDEYSIFKDMVLSSGGKEFDKANSKIIGVDANGNTVYDSVFIYTNAFFDAKGFDLSSEALKATVLVFSDEVIREAMQQADEQLRTWGYRLGNPTDSLYIEGRSDSIMRRWILEAAFFNQEYSAADLTPNLDAADPTTNDISSIYARQWRTSVQQIDLEHPTKLSNAIAYNVTRFKIPTNVLIYRLKENFMQYQYCTADQKAAYFKMTNLKFGSVNTNEVAEWTPLAGVWPMHGNSPLILKKSDNSITSFCLDFTPISSISDGQGGYEVSPKLVPPGTYRLAMGFKQNMNIILDVSVATVNPLTADTTFIIGAEGNVVTDGTVGTTYHYDRGATLPNAYPEGYSPSDPSISHSKAHNYNTDGGLVISDLVVPDYYGNGAPVQLLFRIECKNTATSGSDVTSYTFNHWCLRPTENNY